MSFTLDLRKATENITAETERLVRGTVFGVASRIIKRTPVGNPSLWQDPPPKGYVGGSLRGAWQASLEAPDLSKIKRIDSNGGATISEASKVAMSMDIGQKFYLTNTLPYSFRVEYGWSSQAPEGMVRRSVIETQQVINAL